MKSKRKQRVEVWKNAPPGVLACHFEQIHAFVVTIAVQTEEIKASATKPASRSMIENKRPATRAGRP
jgi:hypothetical protein